MNGLVMDESILAYFDGLVVNKLVMDGLVVDVLFADEQVMGELVEDTAVLLSVRLEYTYEHACDTSIIEQLVVPKTNEKHDDSSNSKVL